MSDDPSSTNRTKPGRKPNPTTPALRKAQNRAAQRAFRERKEKHILELEATSKQLREQRDKLMAENKELKNNVNVMGYEGCHLKGIVLSLQLVCFMNSIAIPNHSPYLDHRNLVAAATADQQEGTAGISPAILATYADARKKNRPPSLAGYHHRHHRHQQQNGIQSCLKMEKKEVPQYVSTDSILVTRDGIQTIVGNRITTRIRADLPLLEKKPAAPAPALSGGGGGGRAPYPCGGVPFYTTSMGSSDRAIYIGVEEDSDDDDGSSKNSDDNDNNSGRGVQQQHQEKEGEEEIPFSARPIMLTREPMVSFNLASFQSLRLRLRLQTACDKMMNGSFMIEPTVLQTSVPHDPRIDLIPIPAMRDRMILFFDLFDLDACFSCVLEGGTEYLGGDPSEPSSWQFPSEFYEKYWYLTHDYSVKDIRQRWPELEQIQRDGRLNAILGKTTTTTMDSSLPLSSFENEQLHLETIVPPSHVVSYSTTTTTNKEDADPCHVPVLLRPPGMF